METRRRRCEWAQAPRSDKGSASRCRRPQRQNERDLQHEDVLGGCAGAWLPPPPMFSHSTYGSAPKPETRR